MLPAGKVNLEAVVLVRDLGNGVLRVRSRAEGHGPRGTGAYQRSGTVVLRKATRKGMPFRWASNAPEIPNVPAGAWPVPSGSAGTLPIPPLRLPAPSGRPFALGRRTCPRRAAIAADSRPPRVRLGFALTTTNELCKLRAAEAQCTSAVLPAPFRPRRQVPLRGKRSIPMARLKTEDVCQLTGISHGQCLHWTRTGLVKPTILGGQGRGHGWTLRDVVALEAIARLRRCGASLQKIRRAASALTAARQGHQGERARGGPRRRSVRSARP